MSLFNRSIARFFVVAGTSLLLALGTANLMAQRYDPEPTQAASTAGTTSPTGETGVLGSLTQAVDEYKWWLVLILVVVVMAIAIRRMLRSSNDAPAKFNPPVDEPYTPPAPKPAPAPAPPKTPIIVVPPAPKTPPATPKPAEQPKPAAPKVTVQISPMSAILKPGETMQFSAKFSTGEQKVAWDLQGKVGSISATGLYTAPAEITEETVVKLYADPQGAGNVDQNPAIIKLLPSPKPAPIIDVKPQPPATPVVKVVEKQTDAPLTPEAPNAPVPAPAAAPSPATDKPEVDPNETISVKPQTGKLPVANAVVAVLALAFAGSAFGAVQCADAQYNLPFFKIGGKTERVICTGLPSAIRTVEFVDKNSRKKISGIQISGITSDAFNITVDKTVQPSRPYMLVNGDNIGVPLRFFDAKDAGVVDASTEIMRGELDKVTAQLRTEIAKRPVSAPAPAGKTTTITKIEVDTVVRQKVADLDTRLTNIQKTLDAALKEDATTTGGGAEGSEEATLADLEAIATKDPEAFKAFIAKYAPVPAPATTAGTGLNEEELLKKANAYTDDKVGGVTGRLATIENDLGPNGQTRRQIDRADNGTKALLEAKLKPKGTSGGQRKEALKAAWAMYGGDSSVAKPAKAKKNKK